MEPQLYLIISLIIVFALFLFYSRVEVNRIKRELSNNGYEYSTKELIELKRSKVPLQWYSNFLVNARNMNLKVDPNLLSVYCQEKQNLTELDELLVAIINSADGEIVNNYIVEKLK